MKSEAYCEVLRKKLLPTIKEWDPEGALEWVFMQDGAPCHNSKKSRAYIKGTGLKLLPWPGNSPDLNPIENMWALLKKKMAMKNTTNIQVLIERLIQTWHHDEDMKTLCAKLVGSMPDRVRAVIKVGGQLTKY